MKSPREYRSLALPAGCLSGRMELSGSMWVDSGARGPIFGQTAGVQAMGSSVLISILVTFLVVILILYLINMLPIAGRAKQIVQIIVIVIGILSLLKYIAVF
jgi:hypothetical protein